MEPVSPVLPRQNSPETILAKDQPQYLPLPVAHVKYNDGTRSMISCWRLSIWERLVILFRGKVWWEQLTFGQPLQPQKMFISEPLSELECKCDR